MMKNPSPLRYPGGKYRFRGLIAESIASLPPPPKVLVEPFCGGAGVSIALMNSQNVDAIALNDADPLVAHFWMVVFGKSRVDRRDIGWLLRKIEKAEITIDAWKSLRASTPLSAREMAWKCLFLNRTSFNGIIHTAGPIGGWTQQLRSLDVRFNREALVTKLENLWVQRERVLDVRNEDWRSFCDRFKDKKRTFFYLDPPYYYKADHLYKHYFNTEQHRDLQKFLIKSKQFWILSYDDSLEVRALYQDAPGVHGLVIDKKYSTHPMGGLSQMGRELFLSNRLFSLGSQVSRGFNLVDTMSFENSPEPGPQRYQVKNLVSPAL